MGKKHFKAKKTAPANTAATEKDAKKVTATGQSTTALIVSNLESPSSAGWAEIFSLLLLILQPKDLHILVLSYSDIHIRFHINLSYLGISHSIGLSKLKDAARDDINKFMGYIARAEQDKKFKEYKAEKMLNDDPSFALVKMPFPQANGGVRWMTALQKAFYSLDFDLWEVIIKYMSPEEITRQLKEHVDECDRAGSPRHVTLTQLLDANEQIESLVMKYKNYRDATVKAVVEYGGAQRALLIEAVNIIHQLCHPNRPLFPCPEFAKEKVFPRSLKFVDHGGESWREQVYWGKPTLDSNSELGLSFYIIRAGFMPEASNIRREKFPGDKKSIELAKAYVGYRRADCAALTGYVKHATLRANTLLKAHNIDCPQAYGEIQNAVSSPEAITAAAARPLSPTTASGTVSAAAPLNAAGIALSTSDHKSATPLQTMNMFVGQRVPGLDDSLGDQKQEVIQVEDGNGYFEPLTATAAELAYSQAYPYK